MSAPAGRPALAHPPAARSRRAWLTLLAFVVFGLVSDLVSKDLAFERIADAPVVIAREAVLGADRIGALIPRHEPIVVVPSVLEFTLVLNEGAVFGIGAGKRWFFVVFTGAAMVFVLWLFATGARARDTWAHAGAGLLIAGGLGNMHDRLRYACVRDFIHPLPGVEVAGREIWPYVSNVADLWVIIGIVLLLWRAWTAQPSPPAGATPNAAEPDAGDKAGATDDAGGADERR